MQGSALEEYLADARQVGGVEGCYLPYCKWYCTQCAPRPGKLSDSGTNTIDRWYTIPDPTFNGLTILKLWVKTSDAASLYKLLGVGGKELSNYQKQEWYVRGKRQLSAAPLPL